ncbi:hypothetical protein B0T22DRAFT_438090 [Podospora appendiculata]|uniref:Multiple RNA-binding domain-containing protein 1 n=1 Tax=Podospora appendiculata TaxID=314037 RepID=A0AAE0XKE3_9PEZI|nr:hypothetical protein B0T22DRAFT_438090 [Podospora appendiculata]
MESSRIYVKNLPPAISEADFRKHFSAEGREVTDVKLIPRRRIGFVGYKSHEDAARAVKYFNRTFIRMSRIGVDLATPAAPGRDAPKDVLLKSKTLGTTAAKDDADARKRKRDPLDVADPKLHEYLEVMGNPSKKSRPEDLAGASMAMAIPAVIPAMEEGESDDEYVEIPSRPRTQAEPASAPVSAPATEPAAREVTVTVPEVEVERNLPAPEDVHDVSMGATDDDWLRSRTNRVLDFVDPDDPSFPIRPAAPAPAAVSVSKAPVVNSAQENEQVEPQSTLDEHEGSAKDLSPESALSMVEKTCRLFLRNLSYAVTEDAIREYFGKFGTLEEVNLPLDNQNKTKGFAMIRYEDPSSAVAAFQMDRSTFQGRIIHILPAAAKRDNTLDEFAMSRLPLKKQHLLRKKAEAVSSTFNWNSLFMSQDAVNTAMAERLGVSKHELLDPTDASAAVKQAIAETTVIQEAKAYFAANGVNIDALKSQQRGDTSILVKNIAHSTIEELRQLFEEHGTVLRVLMPPSGTIAIVQFAQPAQCRAAFVKKAYSRFKESVLFLEKGPKGLFVDNVAPSDDRPAGIQKVSVAELLERDDAEDQLETSSLFVRNLNFATTTEGLIEAFKPLDGFVSAKVKTKTDPKKPGQILSMGFGFCAFKTKEQAHAALKVMDGYVLDAHKLSVKASHKGLDAAEERRREDLAKKGASQRTKIVIKNLPFEASKKDVRTLFSTYGKVVALRIPKKFNQTSRGFAFAEFSTPKEAFNALTSLKDTHFLGRRLVLDYAEAEEVDPEEQIKAMEKKIRGQVNKVALQQLTGVGRTKVNIVQSWAHASEPLPWSDVVFADRWLGFVEGLQDVADVFDPLACQLFVAVAEVFQYGMIKVDPSFAINHSRAGQERPNGVLGIRSSFPAMQLQKRLPVLSSQCYSPMPDYAVEDSHGLPTSRQPLRESTGNAQHQLERLARFQAHRLNLDPLLIPSSSMPTPPIVPTQSLGSAYDAPSYSRLQQRHKIHVQRRRRWGSRGINPISLAPQFQAYRKKQADKDDKSDQKWPDVLEEAFLDALLLVPPMGRKKFSMRGHPYGRNMLIAEYLWVAYCASLPPDMEPDERMRRGRKQVSSHIQVLKNFFRHHTTFHFFFLGEEPKKDKNKERKEDVGDTDLFKKSPVLIALTEGRLPDVRLNFDYFAQILALNDQVTIRPRRTWIFVSNPDLVVGEDGCGHLPATGDKLDKSEYPHLKRNLEREKWAKEEQQIFKGSLVHEFTKEMHQIYSSTVKELSSEWETSFPDLHRRLESIVATDPSCDILHMHSTLELKDKRGFPDGSELNSWIEINIEQPRLLNHRWKVHTQLVRPTVLSYTKENPNPKAVYEASAELAIQYQHRPGCDGPRNGGRDPCDCISQRCKRDWVTVPFPADEWARTLTNCGQYPAHPFTGSGRRVNRGRAAVKKEDEDDDSDGSNYTQMELVPQIAMMQEIWSCPPEAPQDRTTFSYGADSQPSSTPTTQRWTRRALILWTFETVHSVNREGKLVTAQNGKTSWRFLTVIDPTTQYHQQQSLLSGPSSASSNYGDSMTPGGGFSPAASAGPALDRDAIMSPTPNYEQQLNSLSAHMSKNYTAPTTWESQRMHHPSYGAHMIAPSVGGPAASIPAGFDMLDSLGGLSGLATPPPTASLSSSFAPSFDSGLSSADHLYMTAHYHSHSHSAAAGLSATDSQALSDISAVTDPFLASAGSSFDMGGVYDDHGSTDHWDSGAYAHGQAVTGIDASNWPSGYTTAATTAGGSNAGVLGWVQTPPGSRNNSVGHVQPHLQTQQQQQQYWTGADEHGIWIPVTSSADAMAPAPALWSTSGPLLDDEGGAAEGGHDWLHVRSSISTAGGSDLSQDWEEIVNQASEASAAHHHHHHHQQQQEDLQQHMMNTTTSSSQLHIPIRAQQGTKRSRPDSLSAECESYPRTSMPKLTHHHHQATARPSPRHDGGLKQEPW